MEPMYHRMIYARLGKESTYWQDKLSKTCFWSEIQLKNNTYVHETIHLKTLRILPLNICWIFMIGNFSKSLSNSILWIKKLGLCKGYKIF